MDEIVLDEFGGRKRRKRRRKRRRAKFKKIGRKLKKVGKGLAKVAKSKVFKKILSFIPVYGAAAVTAIEAGEKIAGKAKRKVEKVAKIESQVLSAKARGNVRQARALARRGERAAAEAQAALEELGRAKLVKAKLVKKAASKARRGDRRAKAELQRLRASKVAQRSLDRTAMRIAQSSGSKPAGRKTEAPPGDYQVLVVIDGKRRLIPRRLVRARARRMRA